MDNELRLGFHRLGERLENPVNLGVAVGFLWAICAWLIGVAFAITFLQVLLLAVAGVAVMFFLRDEITEASRRMRQAHERLERSRSGSAPASNPS